MRLGRKTTKSGAIAGRFRLTGTLRHGKAFALSRGRAWLMSRTCSTCSAPRKSPRAGVEVREVRELIDSGRVPTIDGRFVAAGPAVEAVRGLRTGALLTTPPESVSAVVGRTARGGRAVNRLRGGARPDARQHRLAARRRPCQPSPARIDPANLVYLVTPGPGGGGGGGGLRQPRPAPRAEMRGKSEQRSPVPTVRVDRGEPAEPKPAPVPDPEPATGAGRATAPAGAARSRPAGGRAGGDPGVRSDRTAPACRPMCCRTRRAAGPARAAARGPARAPGSAKVTAPGSARDRTAAPAAGRTGPGSGVTPPTLLKEVKPDYTEEARRRGHHRRRRARNRRPPRRQRRRRAVDARSRRRPRSARHRGGPPVALLSGAASGYAGRRGRRSRGRIQAAVTIMSTLPCIVSLVSLSLAAAMAVLLARVRREEQQRSDARVAALSGMSATDFLSETSRTPTASPTDREFAPEPTDA